MPALWWDLKQSDLGYLGLTSGRVVQWISFLTLCYQSEHPPLYWYCNITLTKPDGGKTSQMHPYEYLMSSLSQLEGFETDRSPAFCRLSYPASLCLPQLFSLRVGAANNRRRCLWEDKCFLSGRSSLKAVVQGWVSRACLMHWLKCHIDEQTIEARGQSSARTQKPGRTARGTWH